MEIWKDIPGYEGRYMASNTGRIKSIKKYYQDTILSPYKGTIKYLSVGLSKKRVLVHRIIALCFCPNPDNKQFVNHKDGDKMNNSADNLEWVTFQENMDHAYQSGLMHKCKGTKHHKSKLTPNDVFNIRFSRHIHKIPFHVIAELYDVSKPAIRDIIKGKNWAHV